MFEQALQVHAPNGAHIVSPLTLPELRHYTGQVAYNGRALPGGGYQATLWLPLPSGDRHVEISAYFPGGWETELRLAAQRGQARAAVAGPGDASLVWVPSNGGYIAMLANPEIGFIDALLGLVSGGLAPIVNTVTSALGLGNLMGGGAAAGGGAGAGAAGAGAGAAGAGGAAGGAAGGLGALPGLLGLLGNVLGGQAGGSGAAAGLATADALARALSQLSPQLFGSLQGPLAELLRGALRTTEATVRAQTGDPNAQAWVSTAIRSAEGRIADAMRITTSLMNLTSGQS